MSVLENPLLSGEIRSSEAPSVWPFMEKTKTLRVRTVPFGASRTKTDMAEQCDINVILKHYNRTGTVLQRQDGRFEDLPAEMDYQRAMNLVVESRESFESLPAELRDRFHNEPGRLLRFLADPQNRKEAEQLGLVKAPPSPPDNSAAKAPKSAAKAPPAPPEPSAPSDGE